LDPDKTFYITTPIYYVNGIPHVGSATTTLLCDALARFHRLRGERVFFLTGTDEHAQKVADAAARAGVPTQAFADRVSQNFRDCWRYLGVSNDDFIRTSEPRHKEAVGEVFQRLKATGDIYAGKYEGWYSVADETFFREAEVKDGRAIESGAVVEWVSEDVYYFRLSAYGDRLLAHIESHLEFLQPDTRRNEVLAFIKGGLRDVAVSRRNAGWGIPVPGDESQVIYVWFDAVINYLTATGWPGNAAWDSVWPADVHLVGKEIYTRFHATLWPAMLLGLGLPLPRTVLGHGWWLIGGEKGAKSKGNIPNPQEVVDHLAGVGNVSPEAAKDALRYYLLRDISFTSDAEFSLANLIEKRYNPELCNKLGNLLNRTLKMLAQYGGGVIPNSASRTASGALATLAREVVGDVERAMLALDPGLALEKIWKLIDAGNGHIDSAAPWNLHKEGDIEGVADALYAALEATRTAAVLLLPLLPHTAALIHAQLGLPDPAGVDWAHGTLWGGLRAGTRTEEAQPIFPRIDTKKNALPPTGKPAIDKPKKESKPKMADMPPPPPSLGELEKTQTPSTITIDDFAKIQLKIGEIKTADRVEGATKLLRLTVDIGEESPRQILAGIAESYAPDSLVGRKIVVVANLAPRKMRGLESQGMLMAATDAEGHAVLLHPADSDAVQPGAQVR